MNTPRDFAAGGRRELEATQNYGGLRDFFPFGPEHDQAVAQQDFVLNLRQVVRRGRWMILGVFVVTVTLVALASLLVKPKYTATARIVFYREDGDVLGFKNLQPNFPEDADSSISLDTQVKIIQSDTLALQVIRQLRLDQNPLFAKGLGAGQVGTVGQDSAARQSGLRTRFEKALSVSKAKNTRVIEISFTSKDPALAASAANALARAYVEHNFKTKFESTMQTSNWLAQQLSELQVKVEQSQQKLVNYQRAHGILGVDDKQNIVTARLDDLNRELTAAEADRIQKEASYRLTLSQSTELVAKQEPDGLLSRLRSQEASLNLQYSQLTTQLGPANPKVQEVQNQLDTTRTAIAKETQNTSARIYTEYTAALSREHMIRQAFDVQKQTANRLNESAIEYSLLRRDVESNRHLYEGLLERLKEAAVSAGLRSSNIQIVDLAQPPSLPSGPNVPRNIAFSIVLGSGAGMLLAFVRERFDRTLRGTHQVRMASPLPQLGIIPMIPRKVISRVSSSVLNGENSNGSEPPTSERPSSYRVSNIGESFRTALSAVLRSDSVPPRTIAVTSAVTSEGKTTVSVNLAIARARQGKKVLLVDGDVRKGSVSRVFGLPRAAGLATSLIKLQTELVAGKPFTSSHAAIVPAPNIPNLFVLPAGRIDPENVEIVTADGMRSLLAEWRKNFDQIIIDTPPVLLIADALQVAVEADAVLLVVRSGFTMREALRRAQELLYQVNAPVCGIVLNGVETNSPDLYYLREYGSKNAAAS